MFQALLGQGNSPCSVLLISLKLSAVERAHEILVLEKGHVVEQGTHLELMEQGGCYAQLVDNQNRGFQRAEEEGGGR